MSSEASFPDGQLRDDLISAAIEVRTAAYAPFSKYLVGAALLTASDETFTGCNVENSSYGLTICAERVAAVAAVAAGQRKFRALALATADGASPCGACRQFLAEFCDDLPILIVHVDRGNAVREVRLDELLPDRFQR
jgi:cytidine deaminase